MRWWANCSALFAGGVQPRYKPAVISVHVTPVVRTARGIKRQQSLLLELLDDSCRKWCSACQRRTSRSDPDLAASITPDETLSLKAKTTSQPLREKSFRTPWPTSTPPALAVLSPMIHLASPHPLTYPCLGHGFITASCCRLSVHPECSDTHLWLHIRIRAQLGRTSASQPTPLIGVRRHKRWQYGTHKFCGLLDHPRKHFKVS